MTTEIDVLDETCFQRELEKDLVWRLRHEDQGNCFSMAHAVARTLKRLGVEPVIVHGTPTLRRPPFKSFYHAWVEVESPSGMTFAYDYSNGLQAILPVPLYYGLGNIDSVNNLRMSLDEFDRKMLRRKAYNPLIRRKGVLLGGTKAAQKAERGR
jgi:hypothetical protein